MDEYIYWRYSFSIQQTFSGVFNCHMDWQIDWEWIVSICLKIYLVVRMIWFALTTSIRFFFLLLRFDQLVQFLLLFLPYDRLEWFCDRCHGVDTNSPNIIIFVVFFRCNASSGSIDAHIGHLVVELDRLEELCSWCGELDTASLCVRHHLLLCRCCFPSSCSTCTHDGRLVVELDRLKRLCCPSKNHPPCHCLNQLLSPWMLSLFLFNWCSCLLNSIAWSDVAVHAVLSTPIHNASVAICSCVLGCFLSSWPLMLMLVLL